MRDRSKHLSALLVALWCSQVVQSAYVQLHDSEISKPLMEEEMSIPVTQILSGPNYSVALEEKKYYENHISNMLGIENADQIVDFNSVEARKELMEKDWSSLRNKFHEFHSFSKSKIWTEKENNFFSILNELHQDIEPLLSLETFSTSGNKVTLENVQKWQEAKIASGKLDQHLFSMCSDMSTLFKANTFEIRFLNAQRIAFETIHYLYKYQIINKKALDTLFKHYNTIDDLAQYVFHSYRFEQEGIIVPLIQSSKNVLKFDVYSPVKDILKALGKNYEEVFSKEYIKIGMEYSNRFPANAIFDKQFNSELINLGGGLILDQKIDEAVVNKLINILAKPREVFASHYLYTRSSYIFQILEHLKEYHPAEYKIVEEKHEDWKENFELLSLMSINLFDIERTDIYLHKLFKHFENFNSLSHTSAENVVRSNKFLIDLGIFEKYINIIESEYNKIKSNERNFEHPLHIYYQNQFVKNKLYYMKLDISSMEKDCKEVLSSSQIYSPF